MERSHERYAEWGEGATAMWEVMNGGRGDGSGSAVPACYLSQTPTPAAAARTRSSSAQRCVAAPPWRARGGAKDSAIRRACAVFAVFHSAWLLSASFRCGAPTIRPRDTPRQ